ncbi:dihydroxyacetone kinase subunit DhaK [Streptomyces sp. NBC_01716]
MVNGLGATTQLELHAIHSRVTGLLERRGLDVAGRIVGTFVPALDMSGFFLTLTALRDDWHALAPTSAFPATESTR